MTRSPLSSACTLLAMLLAGAGQAAAESFDCIIEPSAISTIVAAEKGVITDVPVARGDMVRKGDVLVRLQSDVEELQLELYRIQAETTVDVASARSAWSCARPNTSARASWKTGRSAAGPMPRKPRSR